MIAASHASYHSTKNAMLQGRTDRRTDGLTNEWTGGRSDGRASGRTYRRARRASRSKRFRHAAPRHYFGQLILSRTISFYYGLKTRVQLPLSTACGGLRRVAISRERGPDEEGCPRPRWTAASGRDCRPWPRRSAAAAAATRRCRCVG